MDVRHFIYLAALGLTACSHGVERRYSMPLSYAEGTVVVPAIVSSAESLGLSAWNHQTSAQVKLQDGTSLWWGPWGAQFVLNIQLSKAASSSDVDAAFRDAKVSADEIWTAAVQARQSNNVGATVLVGSGDKDQERRSLHPSNPPMSSPSQQQVNQPSQFASQPPPRTAGLSAGASCHFSSDCAGGNCRQNVCMGQGGAGAPCWFSSDCVGGNCRQNVCMGQGGPGAPCWFSTDCNSSNCSDKVCR